MFFGSGKVPRKVVPPFTDVSDVVTIFIELDAAFHGPPELDQPLQLGMMTSSPSRRASAHAKRMCSSHAGVLKATGPGGISHPASKRCTPPSPASAIASKSAVMPSLETFPFIQCHHVCGLASRGGLRNPSSNVSANTPAVRPATTTAIATFFIFI